MKITSKNALFSLLIGLFSFITASSTPSWIYNYFHQQKGANYQLNCSLINFAQKIRYAALLLYYQTTHKKNDLGQALASIGEQLDHLHHELLEKEQHVLHAIKEKFKIADNLWDQCVIDTERIKELHRKANQLPHADTLHDSSIPQDIMESLIRLLTENNINPHSVNLVMASQEEAAQSPYLIAQTACYIYQPKKNDQNVLDFAYQYIPATIKIFPRLNNADLATKISNCAHEVQHLVLLHPITTLILLEYFEHYDFNKEELKKSAEYHQLSQIHEAQAEILSAINNPLIANCFKQLRAKDHYPDHLYEEHFYDIATIEMLWKLHDKLEALYFAS